MDSDNVEPLDESQEVALNKLFGKHFMELKDDEASQLSKVLFPSSHTGKVTIAGKERTLSPLSLKFCKRIHAELKPFSEKHQAALNSDAVVALDEDVIGALTIAAKTLAEFYGWEDIAAAVDDESLSLHELQSLAVEQQQLEGCNNFLLGGLRTAIRSQQIYELANVKFQSTFTTSPSVRSSVVLSTPSLADIRKAS